MRPKLGIVIPVYGHFDYAEAAIASAYACTRRAEPVVVVVDDFSPDFRETWFERLRQTHPRVITHRHKANRGLHTAWNCGLHLADHAGCTLACCANSDVLFTPGWDEALIAGLDHAVLVGPVTNAPGTESAQFAGLYAATYRRSDEAAVLAEIATELAGRRDVLPGALNGFCLFAPMATWREFAYSADPWLPFRPRVERNSKGQPNPTPTLTLGEYDLQGRLRERGAITAVCPGSYVFHYRSVTRGAPHARGDWARAGHPEAAPA